MFHGIQCVHISNPQEKLQGIKSTSELCNSNAMVVDASDCTPKRNLSSRSMHYI